MADALKGYNFSDLDLQLKDWRAAKAGAEEKRSRLDTKKRSLVHDEDELAKAEADVARHEAKLRKIVKDIASQGA